MRMRRLLLFVSTTSYRTDAFLAAASELGEPVSLVVASDRRNALEHLTGGSTFAVDFEDADRTLAAVARNADRFGAIGAVVSADDESNLVAARTAEALGLPFHSVPSVEAAGDKLVARRALRDAGIPGPKFAALSVGDGVERAVEQAARLPWPRVLKPTGLSMSRGVLRVDDEAAFREGFARIGRLLARTGGDQVLAETYLHGDEVAVEGLMDHGELLVLAVFDKPEPLVGPTFEETLYITPSRHPESLQAAVLDVVRQGCAALGLRHGPVHAEVRLTQEGPVLLEVAARSIGGQCSRVFTWALGQSLEGLIYRQALGLPLTVPAQLRAAGVLMLPVPRAGELVRVDTAAAESVPGVRAVSITHPPGAAVPLPDGDRYLGFVFADAGTPSEVESILRMAWGRIVVDMQ